jgi:SAM-dependent methyltransferase
MPTPMTDRLGERVVRDIRRTRRHPRPWRGEYLHLRFLLRDLTTALDGLEGSVRDVLDVFCGARPYDDLLPRGARCVGLDVTDRYGVADVVTDDFLPFADASFDLVLCTQAFYYVRDPAPAVAELRRVLRPGGRVILTVPHVWEYDRAAFEHRYTGPALAALFDGWDTVRVVENGGRAVTWTTMTSRLLSLIGGQLGQRSALGRAAAPAVALGQLLLNAVGAALDQAERRLVTGSSTLPPNLLLIARRPVAE